MAGAVAMTLRAGEPEAPSDLELVRLAQAGDTQAFGTLVERNRRAVFRAALAAVGSPAEADDVAQEAFVAAYRKLADFRGEAAFRTWVVSIAWRKALDRRKSITRWLKVTVTPQRFDDRAWRRHGRTEFRPPIAGRGPGRRGARTDDSPADCHAAAEVARRPAALGIRRGTRTSRSEPLLGIPVGTVKWRVSEARRVLKQKLASMGHTR